MLRNRIIMIKLVLGEDIVNVISAYAPQVGLQESLKKEFWEDMDEIIQGIPRGEMIFIGGDLIGRVGLVGKDHERVHGGHEYGEKNDGRVRILEFIMAYDLIIANTFFKKMVEHLITFKSGFNSSQIDFFLARKADRMICKDCKGIV